MGDNLLQAGAGPIHGERYLPSTPDNVTWGWLPNRASEPVLTVASGSTVTIDTISHEGVLEDQGRDPVAWFATHGVAPGEVLRDAVELAASGLSHALAVDGPHVVTGPIAVREAAPGDVLEVEALSLLERAPY